MAKGSGGSKSGSASSAPTIREFKFSMSDISVTNEQKGEVDKMVQSYNDAVKNRVNAIKSAISEGMNASLFKGDPKGFIAGVERYSKVGTNESFGQYVESQVAAIQKNGKLDKNVEFLTTAFANDTATRIMLKQIKSKFKI